MVAPRNSRRVHCYVVEVPTHPYSGLERAPRKPSQLLPWADPYIATLVERLQAEVRDERGQQRQQSSPPTPSSESRKPVDEWPLRSEAEPPRGGRGIEFDASELRFDDDRPRWR